MNSFFELKKYFKIFPKYFNTKSRQQSHNTPNSSTSMKLMKENLTKKLTAIFHLKTVISNEKSKKKESEKMPKGSSAKNKIKLRLMNVSWMEISCER